MIDVFLSVGRTSTQAQEAFVSALIEALRAEGLNPRALGRTEFTSTRPLDLIRDTMRECKGTVIVAFERIYLERASELRGSTAPRQIQKQSVTTVWNHLEGGMAVALGHPLLIVAEDGIRREGLVENSNGWFVQWVDLKPEALGATTFRGALSHWKKQLDALPTSVATKPEDLTVGGVIRGMRVATLWGLGAGLAALVVSAASAGYWFGSRHPDTTAASPPRSPAESRPRLPATASSGAGIIPAQHIRDVANVASGRFRSLAFIAVNTTNGFVMNCEFMYSSRVFTCQNQGIPASVEARDEEIVKRELETTGIGTIHAALLENTPSGYTLTRLQIRIIFDRMGGVDTVQSIEGFATGPDGSEHEIGTRSEP